MTFHWREFSKYFGASLLGLLLDTALLLLLTIWGIPWWVAAPIAFCTGMLLVYMISIRHVFETRKSSTPQREIALFFAIGFGGLLLTQCILWVGSMATVPVLASKIIAAGISFLFNYVVRKWMLFR